MEQDEVLTAAEELSESWASLTHAERLEGFLALPRAEVDEFFLSLTARDQAEILADLPEGEQKFWIRSLSPDDAADVIQESEDEAREHLLNLLDKPSRAEVTALMAYKEDVAGGVMTPRFGRLRREMTVDAAINYLRHQAADLETIYYTYVLDHDQHLLGVVSVRELLRAERGTRIEDIMRTEVAYATEDMPQQEVARVITNRGLLAIPVVDDEMRMKGIITLDDIVEVVQEEANEDIQKVGGTAALDAPYLQTGFFDMFKKRAGWLSILFVGELLTATAMGHYEDEIARAVVLALFLPLIISSGGNSGSQATTLVIQAMAMDELRLSDWFRVVRRELLAGLALGCVLAVIGLLRIVLFQYFSGGAYGPHYLQLGAVVALSLIGVVMFGTLAGSMLPFILRRIGLDPASASAPFVATLVDVTGLVIYFNIALLILRGTML